MQKTFNCDYKNTYKYCRAVVKQLNCTIEASSESKGYVKAKTETSLLSWGEEITIRVEEIARNKCKVTVKSESLQLISWGKDSQNENDILNLLSEKIYK